MNTPSKNIILTLSAITLAATAGLLIAGPLNPPAGPVTSTYKTLSEVEPRTAINAVNTPGDADSIFRITTPGSYYLTGNLQGVIGKRGIEIAADNVTIDLNGFTLQGMTGTLDGIGTDAARSNTRLRNGVLNGWWHDAIDLGGSTGAQIESITANNNLGTGIIATRATITDCAASFNSLGGMVIGDSSIATRCTARSNTGNGIDANNACTMTACIAASNTGNGIDGGGGCTVTGSTANDNDGQGFFLHNTGSIINCAAYANAQVGIYANEACSVTCCTAYSNGTAGIYASSSAVVADCTSNGNNGSGFNLGGLASIRNCSAMSNTQHGIFTGGSSSIIDCTTLYNTLDGINCTLNGNRVHGNTCIGSGSGSGDGAGIHIAGADSRIEGNTCLGCDRGIDVDGPGNIIIRNSCSGNTLDWTIAANNVFAPIIDRRAPASGAVSGFSAAGSLGSTDSNANFSY